MRFRPRKLEYIQLEMTPLIDVVFQLLIFFMLTSSFVLQTGIKVNLPDTRNAETLENTDDIVITIKKDDRIYMNGHIVPLPDLKYEIRKLMEQKPPERVLLQADRFVYYERIVKVMDIVKDLGIKKVALPTRYLDEEVPTF